MQYTLFQNGVHEHESEAKGAKFYEISIDYTTRERFSYILAHFLAKKIFHSYMDNARPLKMKFTAKFVPYDVLLGYNRKICTARSDDNNMATSTVSSYEKLDYNRSCVRAIYPCQMPKNCCVPKCTKKGYIEGKKISYFKFPQEKHLFDEWIRAIRRDVG